MHTLGFLYFTAVILINFLLLGRLRDFAEHRRVLLDVPNERSSHLRTTVRGGGIIFVSSAILTWILVEFYYQRGLFLAMIAGAMVLAYVSFKDDIKPLPIRLRLLIHVLAASLFLYSVPFPSFLVKSIGPWALLWLPLALFFMVAVINLYNFMDGIDGLATAHSLCVLSIWSIAVSISGRPGVDLLICLSVGFSLLPFLLHNWSPARIFMGDVGSTFIGYTLACLAIMQAPTLARATNFFAITALMMPFLFDAAFTLIARFIRGEKWYLPHRSHLFQRLVRLGYSHAAVSVLYALMTLYSGFVVILYTMKWLQSYLLIIPLLVVPYIAFYIWLRSIEERSERSAVIYSSQIKVSGFDKQL